MHASRGPSRPRHERENGQVTVLFALLLVVTLLLAIGVSVVGRVAVDRARARTAADAVVLAGADPQAQQSVIAAWQAQGARVTTSTGSAHVAVGQAQAQAWVHQGTAVVTRAPALVAVVARAEQLVGGDPLVPVAWEADAIVLSPIDAARFLAVAADFGFCATPVPSGATSFGFC